jgi:hypothetical protein
MDFYVRLALSTRQSLAEVMEWEPEALATAMDWLKERLDAEKAAKGR